MSRGVFIIAMMSIWHLEFIQASNVSSDNPPKTSKRMNKDRIHHIKIEHRVNAPASAAWARISDHESIPSFVKQAKKVTLLQAGNPKNGNGAIRKVEWKPAFWATIYENVPYYDEGRQYDYVLYKGLAGLKKHYAKVRVEPLSDSTCLIRWTIDMEFKRLHPFSLFVPSFMKTLEDTINEGVLELKRQLESK
jgi:hypothetical protein